MATLVAFAAAVIVAGACGSPGSSSAQSDAAAVAPSLGPARDVGTASEVAQTAQTAQTAGAGAVGTDVQALDLRPTEVGRSVISSATMSVESDDVIQAKQRAVIIAESSGGRVFDEVTELGVSARSTLTLRVPPDRFRSVMDDLAGIGTLTNQQISTDDVTAQVVDLEARIATAEVSVGRLRGFLDQATTVGEIAQLEGELVARESGLESLRGQKRTLSGRIDLSTIVLTVAPPNSSAAEPATSLPGFLDGLRGGWEAFRDAATVTLATVGWVLPFLPVLLVVAALVRWYRRRRSPVSGSHVPPPPESGAPGPIGATG